MVITRKLTINIHILLSHFHNIYIYTVRCNSGYTAQPTVQTVCLDLERGVWSVAVPICVRIERLCSKPGYISRVVQYVNGLETNQLATYPHDELPEGTFLVSRCSLPGEYVLRGSANRTCSDGGWTGEQPRCVNAATRISFQNNQPLEVRSDGTIVIYPRGQLYIYCRMPYDSYASARFESDNGPTAENGYSYRTKVMNLYPPRTSHSGRFTCRSRDSTLSHSVYVQFAEIYCDSPTAPTNGEIQDYDNGWRHERYYMGKLITFICNDDYTLSGARRMSCVFGEWSHPAPTCKRATCEELRPPTNGNKMGGNRVGDSVLIGCNQGYQLQGEPFLDCQESGNWSHPLPACVGVSECVLPSPTPSIEIEEPSELSSFHGYSEGATCEELHPPTHGIKMGGNRVGDSVLIACNQGYQLQGEPLLNCQESGNWSNPLPACVAQ